MTIGRRCTIRMDCRSPPRAANRYSGNSNPLKLQVSTFTTQTPQGFGLVQRSREQSDFQDFDAQYERRPSAWITPKGD